MESRLHEPKTLGDSEHMPHQGCPGLQRKLEVVGHIVSLKLKGILTTVHVLHYLTPVLPEIALPAGFPRKNAVGLIIVLSSGVLLTFAER